ncbi:MAG: DUF4907 domain-containing protein [Chitinophagaceae bacterium]
MKKISLLIILSIFLKEQIVAQVRPSVTKMQYANQVDKLDPVPKKRSNISGVYTQRIITSNDGTYGYEIYLNNKMIIKQTNIPGISGSNGFRRINDADKIASLVIDKLLKGIMPPTVEKAEMDKLHVQY